MQSKIVEVALVSTLFIGYLVLWKFKQKSLLSRIKINTEIIYRDSRPTQLYLGKVSDVEVMRWIENL